MILSIYRFAGNLLNIPVLYCAAFGGHPHQSEKVLVALFLTASPSREKPLEQDRSFYRKMAQAEFRTRLLPEGRSCQPPAPMSRGLTDVGWCSAQRI